MPKATAIILKEFLDALERLKVKPTSTEHDMAVSASAQPLAPQRALWPAGTGYGFGHCKSEKSQRPNWKSLSVVLQKLALALGDSGLNASELQSTDPTEQFRIFLEECFANDSILEIQSNEDVYTPVTSIMLAIVCRPCNTTIRPRICSSTLLHHIFALRHIYEIFQDITKQSSPQWDLGSQFLKLWRKLEKCPPNVTTRSHLRIDPCSNNSSLSPSIPTGTPKKKRAKTILKRGLSRAFTGAPKDPLPPSPSTQPIGLTSGEAPSLNNTFSPLSSPSSTSVDSTALSTTPKANSEPPTPPKRSEMELKEDKIATYQDQLRPLQIDEMELIASHKFGEKVRKGASRHPRSTLRIAHELTVLSSSSLPLHPDGSIFIRYDPNHIDLMRVLITGPSGTPYARGCFLFDLYLPPSYPDVPPNIKLLTTNNGSVRFNPNLYADGSVCLSLLNTWPGSSVEQWDPQHSTILQVLISIQSIVMCHLPYFNEPGHENFMQSPSAQSHSDRYSANILSYTKLYAIDPWLQPSPPDHNAIFYTISSKHLSLS